MRKAYCDHCGKEIHNDLAVLKISKIGDDPYEFRDTDLCKKCYEDFKYFIRKVERDGAALIAGDPLLKGGIYDRT